MEKSKKPKPSGIKPPNVLTLGESEGVGCIPTPKIWKPKVGEWVKIVNNTEFEQTLSGFDESALRDSPTKGLKGKKVVIKPKKTWVGVAGMVTATYQYIDGIKVDGVLIPRNGTIDPS